MELASYTILTFGVLTMVQVTQLRLTITTAIDSALTSTGAFKHGLPSKLTSANSYYTACSGYTNRRNKNVSGV